MNISDKLIGVFSRSTFLNEEQLRISIEGVVNHKLRSLLTILGIIFGVAAVISMLAIGEGARRKTMSQIQSLGLQNIIVQQQENQTSDDEENNETLLNLGDVEAIKSIVPGLVGAVPVIEREFDATYKSRAAQIVLTGTHPEYLSMMNLKIAKGGIFSAYDNRTYQRVCILGSQAAKDLFLVEDPLGKMVKINDIWFRVVGVLQYQPKSIAGTQEVDLNSNIFAPINSVNVRFERGSEKELEQIVIQLQTESPVIATSNLVDQILYRRHNEVKNYAMIVPEQLLQQSEETQKIFNIVMGAIAGISLLVGGIGIMNIMLASVLERTREIGIRRSLGATRQDIMNQFLTEALILSLLGGIIGIGFGYALALGITYYSDWDTAISIWSVLLSFGVSSGVGIIFGYYPARQAADLNPIEALRYE
ncbi:MAG: ABC transporter permease [Calditrichaeota bacterium]|nr:ABC transporter permease [Calditrichota bacterium]